MTRAIKIVDAFTKVPFLGNPVAVVLDADDLDTAEMQRIAGWFNLSETVFVLPPTTKDADYLVRIFSPRSELPFAGHPTLGTAHAMLEAGRVTLRAGGRVVQECGVGLVPLTVEGEGKDRLLTLDLPPAKVKLLDDEDIEELQSLLGGRVETGPRPAIIDVGAVWSVAEMTDAETVLAIKPDMARAAEFARRHNLTGLAVFGAHEDGAGAAIEVRCFAPTCGVDEDPVCGSGNGSIGVFQRDCGLISNGSSYMATQGRCVGRDGRISVQVDAAGQVRVGGACVTVVDGAIAR